MASNTPKSSLATRPTNLKEAIDWVLRISGMDKKGDDGKGKWGISKLAWTLYNLLEAVIKDQKNVPNKERLLLHLTTFQGWLKSDYQLETNPRGPIHTFALRLQEFIGYNGGDKPDGRGIGKKDEYTSSYDKDTARWGNVSNGDEKNVALNFLDAVIRIVLGLSKLYWQCYHEARWKNQRLIGNGSDLATTLVSHGYDTNQINGDNKTGEVIVNRLKTTFPELETAIGSASSYEAFLKTLKGNAEEDADFIQSLKSEKIFISELTEEQKQAYVGLKVEALSSAPQAYPLYKLCAIAYTYKLATVSDFVNTEEAKVLGAMVDTSKLYTVFGLTAFGAATFAAYWTDFFGLIATFTPLLS
ncbi:variant erythrocyte surface antigen-1 family protein [Babesia caballi]|uniref:Variant erythrocyte surface antigen-1 family protein n=1 Tax=Babesia caballi TaxID=5871 RepID=A0AAV4M0A5_BABCB|nr:variant erythrocyte surface antigen-1 family protein [Babesia caballi]